MKQHPCKESCSGWKAGFEEAQTARQMQALFIGGYVMGLWSRFKLPHDPIAVNCMIALGVPPEKFGLDKSEAHSETSTKNI